VVPSTVIGGRRRCGSGSSPIALVVIFVDLLLKIYAALFIAIDALLRGDRRGSVQRKRKLDMQQGRGRSQGEYDMIVK